MKLIVTIITNKDGVTCDAEMADVDCLSPPEVNLMSVGALEIAKASLLAHRWGVNIAGMKKVAPIVKQKQAKAREMK